MTRHVSFQDEKVAGPCFDMEETVEQYEATITSREDFEARWFTPQELQDILEECKQAVVCSRDHDVVHDIDSSLRGLEMVIGYHDKEVSFLQKRREWTLALLKEQERLREISKDGSVDPVLLAEAIKHICVHRQRVAHLRGIQDAQAVCEGERSMDDITRVVPCSSFDRDKNAELRKKKRSQRSERRGRHNTTLAVRTAVMPIA